MLRIILLAFAQSILLVSGQVFLKLALARMLPFGWTKEFWLDLLVNWRFALAGLFFGGGSLLWMYIVKHYPFSTAYPMVSLSYVFGLVAAVLVFHEEVSVIKWTGAGCIILGCFLIAR